MENKTRGTGYSLSIPTIHAPSDTFFQSDKYNERRHASSSFNGYGLYLAVFSMTIKVTIISQIYVSPNPKVHKGYKPCRKLHSRQEDWTIHFKYRLAYLITTKKMYLEHHISQNHPPSLGS